MEGLSGPVKKVVELGCVFGFRVGPSNFVVSHIQYVDNTLILYETSVDNRWTIKSILRVFELAYVLKVFELAYPGPRHVILRNSVINFILIFYLSF